MRILTATLTLCGIAMLGLGVFAMTIDEQQVVRRDQRAERLSGGSAMAGLVTIDGTGTPLRRAEVSIANLDTGGRQATFSDASGRFIFPSLPAGRYNLSARKPGFLRTSYGQTRYGRPGTPVTLADNQRLDDLTMSLTRGGVLTGRVTDEHGLPAFGVRVRVLEYRTVLGDRQLRPVRDVGGLLGSQTDDRGVYRLYGLPPGDYVVVAEPRNGGANEIRAMTDAEMREALAALQQPVAAQASNSRGSVGGGIATGSIGEQPIQVSATRSQTVGFAPVYFPGTTAASGATTLRLAPGDERTSIDFQLQMVTTSRIEGTVLPPAGIAPESVQLMLIPVDRVGTGSLSISLLGQVRPNAEGKFTYTAIPPGRYALSARATLGQGGSGSGGGTAERRVMMAFQSSDGGAPVVMSGDPDGDAPAYWARAEFAVSGQDLSNVVLSMQPGMTIGGVVQFEGSAAPPDDLSRVSIRLTPAPGAGSGIQFGFPRAEIDASGRFTISNVTPGTYNIAASAPGTAGAFSFTSWNLSSALVNGRDALDFLLEVGPNENVADAVLTFSDQTQEVSGALQDQTGRPAPDYTIVVFPADTAYWRPQARRIDTTRPATDGSFRIQGLPAGDYRIAAVTDLGPEDLNDPAFLEQLAAGSFAFSLAPGEKRIQDLRIAGGGQ